MKFLVDAQLPPSLAVAIRSSGFEAVHLESLGMRDASDGEIWRYAMQSGAVLLTKDEDFANRCMQGTSSPVVVWLRIGNATNRRLLEWFLPLLQTVIARITAGDTLIEVK